MSSLPSHLYVDAALATPRLIAGLVAAQGIVVVRGFVPHSDLPKLGREFEQVLAMDPASTIVYQPSAHQHHVLSYPDVLSRHATREPFIRATHRAFAGLRARIKIT